MSSSKKSEIVPFDLREFLQYFDWNSHGDSTGWDDILGCCSANVLSGLPDIECIRESLHEWKADVRDFDDGRVPERISVNEVFRQAWEKSLEEDTYRSLGVMFLTQTQHNPVIRGMLKARGWKKCGQKLAQTGNTVSLWAKF